MVFVGAYLDRRAVVRGPNSSGTRAHDSLDSKPFAGGSRGCRVASHVRLSTLAWPDFSAGWLDSHLQQGLPENPPPLFPDLPDDVLGCRPGSPGLGLLPAVSGTRTARG